MGLERRVGSTEWNVLRLKGFACHPIAMLLLYKETVWCFLKAHPVLSVTFFHLLNYYNPRCLMLHLICSERTELLAVIRKQCTVLVSNVFDFFVWMQLKFGIVSHPL